MRANSNKVIPVQGERQLTNTRLFFVMLITLFVGAYAPAAPSNPVDRFAGMQCCRNKCDLAGLSDGELRGWQAESNRAGPKGTRSMKRIVMIVRPAQSVAP